jgi:hypothetical protein
MRGVSCMRGKQMRAIVFTLLGFGIAACASGAYTPSAAPDLTNAAVVDRIRKVFAETKLHGTMQVSRPRAAHLVSPGDWLICMRSSDRKESLLYAIYFRGNDYVTSQASVVIDRCEQEIYAGFGDPPKPN